MSDERPVPLPLAATPPAAEHDYDAILSALMETPRGRWFLEEYARRSRSAETKLVLDAIARLESHIVRTEGDRDAERAEPDAEPVAVPAADTAPAAEIDASPAVERADTAFAEVPTLAATEAEPAVAGEPTRTPAEPADPAATGPHPAPDIGDLEYPPRPQDPATMPLDPVAFAPDAPMEPAAPVVSRELIEQLDLLAGREAQAAPSAKEPSSSAPPEEAGTQGMVEDPLAPLRAMSQAERIALFS